jgi:hypothetical protein
MTGYKVVMLVENSSVPGDRRVWMEALTLARAPPRLQGIGHLCAPRFTEVI